MKATFDVARCAFVCGSPAVDIGGYLGHGNDAVEWQRGQPRKITAGLISACTVFLTGATLLLHLTTVGSDRLPA